MDKPTRKIASINLFIVIAIAVVIVIACIAAGVGRDEQKKPQVDFISIPVNMGHYSVSYIDSFHYTSTNSRDSGTVRIYIRNTNTIPLKIHDILLNGSAVKVWGINQTISEAQQFFLCHPSGPREVGRPDGQAAAVAVLPPDGSPLDLKAVMRQAAERRLLWAYCEPNPIPPGGVGEFVAKIRDAPSAPLRFQFQVADGVEFEQTVSLRSDSLRLSAVTFSTRLDTAYLYVESDTPQRLQRVEIDGRDLTDHTEWTSTELQPSEKQLAVVHLSKPLPPTDNVIVKVIADNGIAEDRVKVAHFFPIHSESGIGDSALSLDAETFLAKPFLVMGDEKVPYAPQKEGRADYILECMNHRFGDDWERTAKMLLLRKYLSRQNAPERLTVAHHCRNDPSVAFPRFSRMTDAVSVNPSYSAIVVNADTQDWQAAQNTFGLARKSQNPLPAIAVLSTEKFGNPSIPASPDEFRRRLYAVLAMAPKGILYRLATLNAAHPDLSSETGLSTALAAEIVSFNTAIRPFREQLAITDALPASYATTTSPEVVPFVLLAGDRGVFLILIRKEPASIAANPVASPYELPVTLTPAKAGEPSGGGEEMAGAITAGEGVPAEGVMTIHLRLPGEWASRLKESAASLSGLSITHIDAPGEMGACVVSFPAPAIAEAYWVSLE